MISDEEIYQYLLGEFEIGGMYIAPPELRQGDTNASFGVYERGGRLRWHDFGLPRKPVGDKAVDLIMEMRGVSYREAKRIIEKEIVPARMGRPKPSLRRVDHLQGLPYIVHRDHNEYELAYWKKFGQTKFDLIYESIYALDYMQYTSNPYKFRSLPEDPAFIYLFKTNPYKCKLYRPYNSSSKFRMFNCAGVIEGWESMLREFTTLGRPLDRMFITSSTKDRLCWKKCVSLEESAINPLSEKILRDVIAKKSELTSIVKEIIVIFDGDPTGKAMAKSLAEDLGGAFVDVTEKLGWDDEKDRPVKDLARCTELFGIDSLRVFYNQV